MQTTRSDSSRQHPDHHERQVVLCLDGRAVTICEQRTTSLPDGGRAEVTVDHGAPHRLVLPGWQELRFSVSKGPKLLLWSARDLWALDVRSDVVEQFFASDEDIRFVHALDDGLLVVCETSLRTVDREGRQVSRLELPEVIADVSLDASSLTIRNVQGDKRLAALEGLHLVAASMVSG